MDAKNQAALTTQIAAVGLAVKALISTHPDGEAFAVAFREYVASFQTSAAFLESGDAARQMFREQCSSLLEEVRPAK